MTPRPYSPARSLTPFEAFRLGVREARAHIALTESAALIAEGRALAARLMSEVAA